MRAYVNCICALSEYEKNFIMENMNMQKSSNYSAFSQEKNDACLNYLGNGFHERFSQYLITKFLQCVAASPGLEIAVAEKSGVEDAASCPCSLSVNGDAVRISGELNASASSSPLSLPVLLKATSGYSPIAVDNSINRIDANKLLKERAFSIPNNEITPDVLSKIKNGTIRKWTASAISDRADVMPMIMFKFLLHMLIKFTTLRLFEDFYANLVEQCPESMGKDLPRLTRIEIADILEARILEQATSKTFSECESACSFLLCNLPIMSQNIDLIMENISLQLAKISS